MKEGGSDLDHCFLILYTFRSYLESLGQQALLGLWGSVQQLKEAEKTQWHQLATQVPTYLPKS